MRRPHPQSNRLLISCMTLGIWLTVFVLKGNSVSAQQHLSEPTIVHNNIAVETPSDAMQLVSVKGCFSNQNICVDSQDEIWVVSAHQPCGNTSDECSVTEFHTQRLECSQWKPRSVSDLAAAHQSDLEHVTVLVFHGNNTNGEWALTRGMQFYDQVFGQHPDGRPPVRLVILAWESAKVLPRPCPDYKLKSARAVSLGPSIGALLDELSGPRPVLVGYSLGAQVVLSAMTEMASRESENSIGCQQGSGGCQQGFQLALVAPALNADFACGDLASIGSNPLIDRAEIFVNRNDRVLRAARLLNRKRCDDPTIEPSLIGLVDKGRVDLNRFQLHDVTREVRNRHSLVNYIESSNLKCRIRQIVSDVAPEHLNQIVETELGASVEEITATETIAAEEDSVKAIQR